MSDEAVIYEVNLSMSPALYARERAWLQEHIQAMLQHDGFRGATMHAVEPLDTSDAAQTTHLSIHYQVASREHLQRYFDNAAAAMRADGLAHLGDGCLFRRRILGQLKSWRSG